MSAPSMRPRSVSSLGFMRPILRPKRGTRGEQYAHASSRSYGLKRTISGIRRINTRWTIRGHEEGHHIVHFHRSFVARDPHIPAFLNEYGTGGMNRAGAGRIVAMVERDRSGFYDDNHGTGM